MPLRVFSRHLTLIDRLEFDVVGVRNGAPDDIPGSAVFKPTPVGVVTAKIGVDGVIHRLDIALTRDLTRRDDLPGIVEFGGLLVEHTRRCCPLHETDGDRTHRRLVRYLLRRIGRVPGNQFALTRQPVSDSADRNLGDLQILPPDSDRLRPLLGGAVARFQDSLRR